MKPLTNNAIQILEDRYLLRDENGILIESPNEMFHRVAAFVSSSEKTDQNIWKQQFYRVMSNLEFLPNSPTLMNAGCFNGQLSACFVLPIEDSLKGIFTTLKNAALIHQSGGGTGFNFSKLRPKNDLVSSRSGTSSGPIAFMKIYDAATEYVKQGGKRKGANMGILNISHPDIEDFIKSKTSKKAIENFNISVGITDKFIKAIKNDLDWSLINPRTKNVDKIISAKSLWQLIVKEAWHSGDPGLIFLDTINKVNPTPNLGAIQTTNPCGELPLLDYESCNLGSINLSKMVVIKKDSCNIDWRKLSEVVNTSIRFLDNVISLNYYILSEIETMTNANRKIGLGVMGWAELLILLEIPYASKKAIALAEKLMQFIKDKSYKASEALAKEKGVFPEWKNSNHITKTAIRNASCNSIAPTGTLSVIANTSYSIEPLFALAYKRVGILDDKSQFKINTLCIKKLKALGLWSKQVENSILKTGSISGINTIPKKVQALFKTSLEIPWKYHLLHQKAFQKYTDNAVSKTINLPKNTTIETVSDIYITAWEYKLKGITIYRYGSKEQQVLQKCNLYTSGNC